MGNVKTVEEIKPKRDFDFLRNLLNNIGLLKFVRRHSADNIQENMKFAEKLGITVRDDSVAISDKSNIKMLVTNAIYSGKKHLIIDLGQLAEAIADMGAKGRLVVSDKENYPCFLETEEGTNLCIIAPKVED